MAEIRNKDQQQTAMTAAPTPDWNPFWVDRGSRLPPRPLGSPGNAGIGDRLRSAAFAEMQAEQAFLWAATHYSDAPSKLREDWRVLAAEERKHRLWLLSRLNELNLSLEERPVSDSLWLSLTSRPNAKDFSHFMAGAEERGRRAGERFYKDLQDKDPKTAEIFRLIAMEEAIHIEIAYRYFPKA